MGMGVKSGQNGCFLPFTLKYPTPPQLYLGKNTMKHILLLLPFWLIPFISHSSSQLSQTYVSSDSVFTFTKDGFTDFVVVDCDTLSARDIFWKTVDWINKTYKNPNEVLLTQVEGDYLIFMGVGPNMVHIPGLGEKIYFDIRYRITVYFKNGRYRFEVNSLEIGNQGNWSDMLSNFFYYKKNGEIRYTYKDYEVSIPKYINKLNQRLRDYILNSENSKKNDW